MRKWLLIALALALAAGCGGTSEWHVLSVPEGGFAILMDPTEHTRIGSQQQDAQRPEIGVD